MPERVQEAMQMQVEAERKKRAAILESEGTFFCRYSFHEIIFMIFSSKVSKRLRLMWQRVKNKQKFLNQVIC